MLTAGPVSKMASQQEKAFCVLRFEVSTSVITVQREFRAWFRCVFSKPSCVPHVYPFVPFCAPLMYPLVLLMCTVLCPSCLPFCVPLMYPLVLVMCTVLCFSCVLSCALNVYPFVLLSCTLLCSSCVPFCAPPVYPFIPFICTHLCLSYSGRVQKQILTRNVLSSVQKSALSMNSTVIP